jgi:hypothetical protein
MIAPDFRNTEVPNFLDAYKSFIVKNHGIGSFYSILFVGDGLWKDLEPEFNRVNNLRREICQVSVHRSDPEQLKKFRDLFLE